MSDDELSDDMQELNELIAEYRSKEEEEKNEEQQENSPEDNTKTSVQNDDINDNEVPMDKVLFGDKAKLLKNLENAITKPSKKNKAVKVETDSDESADDEKNEANDGGKRKAKKRKPVWTDANDEEIELGEVKRETKRTGPLDHLNMDKTYKEYLTSRFTRLVNQPKWASLDEKQKKDSDEEDDDDKLLRTVGFLNKKPEGILTSGHLNMKVMKDLNRATYAEGYINSIQFHPSSTAALVAGDHGIATIYAIDGIQNEKLHNIHIPNFPIRCARLLPCGTKAVFGSDTRYAYLYDLMSAKESCLKLRRNFGNLSNFTVSPCGRYLATAGICGEIHIYEAKTFEHIRSLKQNDEVASLRFTGDSQRLIVSGNSSNVCVFSMRQQRLEHKFIDDGCIVGSVMDLSPNQRLLAMGSKEGVVNVYDFDKVMLSSTPQPLKTFLNLTTGISCVRFNHSSELLAFCSNMSKDAVKIAHFPSATVYANFPRNDLKLGHVRTLEFSPQSAYFAIGTTKSCPLFRIKHFKNY
ncbi:U3 small nucleolar RNA-associated protein 18 homolog [Calliphora vicina]|uniref:U3 small nucleolar RNA-associated protein 18 homolog n=1 Tax=Calliphora vicina TaxID=7373 RepID=UPI00325A46D1